MLVINKLPPPRAFRTAWIDKKIRKNAKKIKIGEKFFA